MRRVIDDNMDEQVQGGNDGVRYHYRKDYLYNGGTHDPEKYSLVLVYAKEPCPPAGT